MSNLSTEFMGLSLPNPVVVSSSGLTAKLAGVQKAVNAGAGAVVLKSLFEEDIAASVKQSREASSISHPEVKLICGRWVCFSNRMNISPL